MNAMSWHTMDRDAALKELETDPQKGLDNDEAQRRIEKYGYNELKQEERISPFTILIDQFKNILIIILIFSIALSALVGELVNAAAILAIVIFCVVLGFIQEYRAERAMEALKKMLSPAITAIRGGKRRRPPRARLFRGMCCWPFFERP